MPKSSTFTAAVGVIDLRGGKAVHAIAGERRLYQPVKIPGIDPGNALQLLEAYRRLGVGAIYVADLDAIESGIDDSWLQVKELVLGAGVPIWVDRGLGRSPGIPDAMRAFLEAQRSSGNSATSKTIGGTTWVVPSETLRSIHNLQSLSEELEGLGQSIAVSVDLRSGRLQTPNPVWQNDGATAFVRRIAKFGVHRFVVVDLALVGTGQSDACLRFVSALTEAYPKIQVVAGSGIANREDFDAWRKLGLRGVLTASWLQQELRRSELESEPATPRNV